MRSARGISWTLLNKLSLSLFIAAISLQGCKPRGTSTANSGIQSDISFNGETIGLDRYIANDSDYSGLKREFAAMAAGNGGKPNYTDGEYKIRNDLKPVFSTISGYSMRMEEQVALLVWTVGNVGQNPPFERINKALRSPTVTDDREVASTVRVLASSVNKLRGRTCTGVRGVRNLPDSFLSLGQGETFKDNGFVAFGTGSAPPVPFNQSPIYIYVKSPNCKLISEFSKYGAENEVLFPPGTDFVVESNRTEGSRRVFRLTHDGGPKPGSPQPAGDGDAGVGAPPPPPAGGGDLPAADGSLSFRDFVTSKFRDTAGRTLWLNADKACSGKKATGNPRACKWEFAAPDQISVVFGDDGANWFYKALSRNKICFTGEGAPGANCVGEMTRYTP